MLSQYHQSYSEQTNEEIQRRIKAKLEELRAIFKRVRLGTAGETVRIAVLGCGDKRFVSGHKRIFEEVLKKTVNIVTFDITIEHLGGEKNIFQHDCTLPLPQGHYDIVYAHVLLRFIETEKQWDLIRNSFDALKSGGIAIHLLDKEDYETEELKLSKGLFSVPLNKWKAELDELSIEFRLIQVKYGLAFVIFKN